MRCNTAFQVAVRFVPSPPNGQAGGQQRQMIVEPADGPIWSPTVMGEAQLQGTEEDLFQAWTRGTLTNMDIVAALGDRGLRMFMDKKEAGTQCHTVASSSDVESTRP